MEKKKSLEWRNCSEAELPERIQSWARQIAFPGTLVLLEGEMGAGKSALARLVIQSLASGTQTQGSPTFPLVQEYRADSGFPIFHIDLYRLKNEEELNDSGIGEQIDSDEAFVMVEWGSLFLDFLKPYWNQVKKKRVIRVSISIENAGSRNYKIEVLSN